MIKQLIKTFLLSLTLLCLDTPAQDQPPPQSAPQQVESGSKQPTQIDAWRQAMPELEQPPTAAMDSAAIAEIEASGTGAESKLLSLEDEWLNAVTEKNKAALARILGADFTYLDARAGATAISRNDYIAFATRAPEAAYKLDKSSVRLYADTAIIELKFVRKSARKESEKAGNADEALLTTDVWVRRNNVWEAVARHTSLAPAENAVIETDNKTPKPE